MPIAPIFKHKAINIVITLLSFYSFSAHANNTTEKVQPTQPNIIFMMADDLGWTDIGSKLGTAGFGSRYYQTPNIDALARQGMSFTHAYTQQNCQPTRAALISGQYATGKFNDTYNVVSLNRWSEKSPEWPYITITPYQQRGNVAVEATSLFEMAKSAGYTTAWFGKNHGTGETAHLGTAHGIDHNVASNKNVTAVVNGKRVTSQYFALKDDKKGWVLDKPLMQYAHPYTEAYIRENLLPYANGNDPTALVGTPKHYSDALTDAIVDYLADQSTKSQPFIAYIPFHAVHSRIVPRPDLHQKYKALPSTDPRHNNAKYAGFVEQLDQMVGRIMAQVDRLELTENTLIVFTSDNGGINKNGFTNNSPLRGDKGTFYEGGLRVPFIVKWPDVIEAGTVSNQTTHSIDLYPTLAQITGAHLNEVTQTLDGESLLPLLTGESDKLERDTLYWHFPGYMDERNYPRSLIQKHVDGNVYKLFFDYGSGRYELYNITKDHQEQVNLLVEPTVRITEIALDMNTDLIQWLQSRSAPRGHWRINGDAVSYPSLDMKSYKPISQKGLTPLSDKDILRPWG